MSVTIYDKSKGLADNVVSYIHQDSKGEMWFATENGLTSFNGHSFTNHLVEQNVKPMEKFGTGTYYSAIAEQYNQLLYSVNNGQIVAYDKLMERFCEVTVEVADTIYQRRNELMDICCLKDSAIAFLTKRSLFFSTTRYDVEKKTVFVQNVKSFKLETDIDESIKQILFDPIRQQLIALTNRGHILFIDPYLQEIKDTVLITQYTGKDLIPSDIYVDDHYLFVTYHNWNRVVFYSYATQRIRSIKYSNKLAADRHAPLRIRCVTGLGDDRYFVGTDEGFCITQMDAATERPAWINYYSDATLQKLFGFTPLILTCYASDQRLWMGTSGSGVVTLRLAELEIGHTFYSCRYPVVDFLKDSKNHVWMAAKSEGIYKSSQELVSEGTDLKFSKIDIPGMADAQPSCFYMDVDSCVWIGCCHLGLVKWDPRTNRMQIKAKPVKRGKENTMFDFFQDSNGLYWAGTSKGLYQYDDARGIFIKMFNRGKNDLACFNGPVYAIEQEPSGTLWIGTYKGLFYKTDLDYFGQELQPNKKFSVFDLDMDVRRRKMFVSCNGGIGVYDMDKRVISYFYDRATGMSDSYVFSLALSRSGYLWAATRSGLLKIEDDKKMVINYPELIKAVVEVKCYGNDIYAAGPFDMIYFDNRKVEQYVNKSKKMYITELNIDNSRVQVGQKINGEVILTQNLDLTQKVELNYENSTFTLGFTDYSYDNGQIYQYRMYPYQTNWISVKADEQAVFTKVPPGDYTFEIRGLYASDSAEAPVTTLQVKVKQQFYKSPAFYWILLCITLLLLGLIVRQVLHTSHQKSIREKLNSDLKVAKVEKEFGQSSIKEMEQFYSYVAHELRTPLTLIMSPLEDLIAKSEATSPNHDRLVKINANVQLLSNLIERLLLVRKLQSGKVRLQLEQADVYTVVKSVAMEFADLASSRHVTYEVAIPNEPCVIWMDKEKIASVVRNVISNAFKYSADFSRVAVKVVSTLVDEVRYCEIRISDSGQGISKSEIDKLCEPYYVGKRDPAYSTQMGLGLYIVKMFINQHHGLIRVESEEDKGSTFRLLIPLEGNFANERGVDAAPLVQPGSPEEVTPAEGREVATANFAKMDLLIVDDNPENRALVRSLFEAKYNVVEAENGAEALERMHKVLPIAVISDVNMPLMNGFEFCKKALSDSELYDIPIIFLTARTDEESLVEGMACGAMAYMTKPFNPDALQATLSEIVWRRKSFRAFALKTFMIKYDLTPDTFKVNKEINAFVNSMVETMRKQPQADGRVYALLNNVPYAELKKQVRNISSLDAEAFVKRARVAMVAYLYYRENIDEKTMMELLGVHNMKQLKSMFKKNTGTEYESFIDLFQRKRVYEAQRI